MRGQKFHHCDLACRNVKVGKGLVAKMADFGMASDVSADGSTSRQQRQISHLSNDSSSIAIAYEVQE